MTGVPPPGATGDEVLPRSGPAKIIDRYRSNDTPWLAFHLLGRTFTRAGSYFDSRARRRERERDLPGVNTRDYNRRKWSAYDWSALGTEWSSSDEWQLGLVEHLLAPSVPTGSDVLEIGPGGGRWTGSLLERSRHLTVVDITERSISMLRERFVDADNVSYSVTDGRSLTDVADASVDVVWSFDVFVHIAPTDQKAYLSELARVMRPGATAVIHHAGKGGTDEGWRASMTDDLFRSLAGSAGLDVVRQFTRFGPDDRYGLPEPGDTVTVLRRPGGAA